MKNPIGTVIAIIAIFLLLFVTPNFYIGTIQWAKAQSEALSYTRNIVDEVIDTRELTQDMLDDYTLNMSSTTEYYKFEITRKIKCVMPDPVNAGKTYSTYIVVDNINEYNQGDKFIVDVEPVGVNSFQVLAASLMGMPELTDGFRLEGRVR